LENPQKYFKKLAHFKRITERSPTDHHSRQKHHKQTFIFQNTILGDLGGDFHVCPRMVSLAGGAAQSSPA
jgi:hypothetical protein